MHQTLQSIFFTATLLSAIPAVAQIPGPPPIPDQGQRAAVVEKSRIARFIAGPNDRPQGFLLRNGTFVTLSPGLAEKLPMALDRNRSVRVAGEELSYEGNKTIAATTVTIGDLSFNDNAAPLSPRPEMASAAPPPLPPTPAGPAPRGPVPPPPPSACGAAIPPPPTPPAGIGPAAPPPNGNAPVPPPPAPDSAVAPVDAPPPAPQQ